MAIEKGMPTVPPAGWFGTVKDFFNQGLSVYKEYNQIKASVKPAPAPAPAATVAPQIITVKEVSPQYQAANIGREQTALPSNTIIVGAGEKGSQGTQTVPAPEPKKDNTLLYVGLGLGAAALLFVMLKRGR